MSLLLEREPFARILEATLARFLTARTGRPHAVEWKRRAFGGRGQAQEWLVNIYLNAIFQPDASAKTLEPVRREFARSVRWRRRLPQRAYVELATRAPTHRMLAQARLRIEPALEGAEGLLIVGGNSRIRVLDRGQGRAYSLLKDGFPADRLARELTARRLAETCRVPVPPLLEVPEGLAWFAEKYVVGTPANRLPDQRHAAAALQRAFDALAPLRSVTRSSVRAREYVLELTAEVEGMQARAALSSELRAQVRAFLDAARAHSGRLADGETIELAMTHGDLQPANVLIDGDAIHIIDWEAAGTRQWLHDRLVQVLDARAPEGLAARVRAVLEGRSGFAAMKSCDEENWGDARRRRLTLLILLLELLAYYLEEVAPTPISRPGPGLGALLLEARPWLEAVA